MHNPLSGNGGWPSAFLLPDPSTCPEEMKMGCGKYGRWPASGEMDIFELINEDSCLTGNWGTVTSFLAFEKR